MTDKKYFSVFTLCGVGLMLLFILILVLGEANAAFLKNEGGIVETASALGYFVSAAYIVYRGGWSFLSKWPYFPLLIILFGFRELDFDKAFTTMGIFKSRFYLSPEVPFFEKCLGGFFILLLLWILWSLIRNHLAGLIAGLKRFSVESVGAALAIGLIVVAKSIDGLPRKLESIGIAGGEAMAYHFGVLEEVMELGIPIAIFLSFHAWFNKPLSSNEGTTGSLPASRD